MKILQHDLYLFVNPNLVKMGTYRAQIEIVSDILDVAQENTFDSNGASVTHLVRCANISHGRLSKILENLVSQGLLEQVNSDRANKYKISLSGREFLQAYKTFSKFTDDFGLTI